MADLCASPVLMGLMALLLMCLSSWIAIKIHRQRKPRSDFKLPPGPPPLPIIGNLHSVLGRVPHRTLRAFSQKYGPLMLLRLGSIPTVVVSSPQMAREFLATRDPNFAGRPLTSAGKYMTSDFRGIALAPYGPYWRQMRKVCVLHLLNSARLESLKFVRDEEVSLMIDSIKGFINSPVNVSDAVSTVASNIICRMAFGRNDPHVKGIAREGFFLAAVFNIGDFIPWLEWMDLQGLRRRQRKWRNRYDAFLDKVIDERLDQKNVHRDFMDVMLATSDDRDDDNAKSEVTREDIKSVILDVLSGGTDTSAVTLEWAMSELLRNPSIMAKTREELESAIGGKRKVEECDLAGLPYLKAVVKETMRLHPPGPFSLPHESAEACTVRGYAIPGKARVIVNLWAIGRDPNTWEDAEIFKPERFLGSPIDLKGQHFELIPFGSGRRACPGLQLGLVVVETVLANLLYCFDWTLPQGMRGEDLDMQETFGLTTPRAVNLFAVPTVRSTP